MEKVETARDPFVNLQTHSKPNYGVLNNKLTGTYQSVMQFRLSLANKMKKKTFSGSNGFQICKWIYFAILIFVIIEEMASGSIWKEWIWQNNHAYIWNTA